MMLEDKINEVKHRGRFRFVIIVEDVRFFSTPLTKEELIYKWIHHFDDEPSLYAIEYESTTEYTPGNYVWQVL